MTVTVSIDVGIFLVDLPAEFEKHLVTSDPDHEVEWDGETIPPGAHLDYLISYIQRGEYTELTLVWDEIDQFPFLGHFGVVAKSNTKNYYSSTKNYRFTAPTTTAEEDAQLQRLLTAWLPFFPELKIETGVTVNNS